jgi:hypothetical protein
MGGVTADVVPPDVTNTMPTAAGAATARILAASQRIGRSFFGWLDEVRSSPCRAWSM